ncbi:MAG: ABC transporter permease subunit [Acidimicrobiia bacterium]
MRRSIFGKDLRDQVPGLVGWSIGVVMTVGIMGAFWPSMRDMAHIEPFLEAYPEQMRDLFDIDAMTSGSGFLNVELFSIMLPIIFLVFGIARGARSVAGEEEDGTLEMLASLSVPRVRILVEKAAVLVVAVATLGAVTLASTVATSALFDMGVPLAEAAAATAAMVAMGVEFGLVALAVGAHVGVRGVALGSASALAVASYLLYVAGVFVDWAETWRVFSPFQQALGGGPIGGGWQVSFLWMPAVGILAMLVVAHRFDRRDLGS